MHPQVKTVQATLPGKSSSVIFRKPKRIFSIKSVSVNNLFCQEKSNRDKNSGTMHCISRNLCHVYTIPHYIDMSSKKNTIYSISPQNNFVIFIDFSLDILSFTCFRESCFAVFFPKYCFTSWSYNIFSSKMDLTGNIFTPFQILSASCRHFSSTMAAVSGAKGLDRGVSS